MFQLRTTPGASKSVLYRELCGQVAGLLADETDWLANTANVAALIYQGLPGLNWAGFYFLRGGAWVLGPFQGRVACVRIKLSRVVCGAAAQRREVIVVPDVAQFPGHIPCDHASRSEIVLPPSRTARCNPLEARPPSVAIVRPPHPSRTISPRERGPLARISLSKNDTPGPGSTPRIASLPSVPTPLTPRG